jgi:hypothetical protein
MRTRDGQRKFSVRGRLKQNRCKPRTLSLEVGLLRRALPLQNATLRDVLRGVYFRCASRNLVSDGNNQWTRLGSGARRKSVTKKNWRYLTGVPRQEADAM